jgi:NAD(P)-dependent dehydrogenase (short-subunit alcohol dehydrogenase family)
VRQTLQPQAAGCAADFGAASARRCAEGGREALGVICDVANYEPCEAMISASAKAFGRVDILVNNAALFALKGT